MHIRSATKADAALLFAWRNDPLTREMSKTTDPVEWHDHLKWLEARLSRSDPHLYIAEESGKPVATVRVDDDGSLSYTVAREHRGCGVAVRMLTLVRKRFGPLRAEIKPGNIASIRAAEKAGHIVHLL